MTNNAAVIDGLLRWASEHEYEPAIMDLHVATRIVFAYCMERSVTLDIEGLNQAVAQLCQQVHKSATFNKNGHTLTVAELRNLLSGLPGSYPIVFQKIAEDRFAHSDFNIREFVWDSVQVTGFEPSLENEKTVTIEGQLVHQVMAEYLPAFGAHVSTDDAGGHAVCINVDY